MKKLIAAMTAMMLLTVAGLSACTTKAKQVSNETESNQTKTDMSNMSELQPNYWWIKFE